MGNQSLPWVDDDRLDSGVCLGDQGKTSAWIRLLDRVEQLNLADRNHYVSVDWKSEAEFTADMGQQPQGYELARNNPRRGFSRLNCRWSKNQSPLKWRA